MRKNFLRINSGVIRYSCGTRIRKQQQEAREREESKKTQVFKDLRQFGCVHASGRLPVVKGPVNVRQHQGGFADYCGNHSGAALCRTIRDVRSK